jgi:hypothetical protein
VDASEVEGHGNLLAGFADDVVRPNIGVSQRYDQGTITNRSFGNLEHWQDSRVQPPRAEVIFSPSGHHPEASLDNLEAALRGPEGPREAEEFAAVRDPLDRINVTPGAKGSSPDVEVGGDLSRFLAPSGSSSG